MKRDYLKHLGFITATAIATSKIINMNAQEARKIATSTTSDLVKSQLEAVIAGIKKSCNEGKYTCTYMGDLLPGSIKQLTDDGFKVESKSDEDRGQRMYWTEINW